MQVVPQKQKVALKYVDSASEAGATWTAKATVKTNALAEQPAIEVTRAWSF